MATLNLTYFRVNGGRQKIGTCGPAQAPSVEDNEPLVDAVAVARTTALVLAITGAVAAFVG